MVSASKVALYLKGLNFPADKKQIIRCAKKNDAPQDVILILQQLPNGLYYSIAGIWEALSQIAA